MLASALEDGRGNDRPQTNVVMITTQASGLRVLGLGLGFRV